MTALLLILLALSAGVMAFYVWGMKKMRKQKCGILLCVPPFLVNAITSQIAIYFAIILWATHPSISLINLNGWMMIFSPVLIQTILNQLLYFLYYKKKKKLTGKQYFLASLAGMLGIIIYVTYLELSLYYIVSGM
jgi:hypothetical protein